MQLAILLIAIGLLLLAGLASDWIGHKTRLPRVTLLLACGIIVGAPGLNLLPAQSAELYEFMSVTALTMVAFLLGSALTRKKLARHGRAILWISAMIVLSSMLVVSAGLWLLGVPAAAAILLGAIATATDPAATQDAIRQSGAHGAFADRLRGIVAIDDAWGLIAFSIAMVLAQGMNGGAELSHLGLAAWEIFGAVTLGLVIGLPSAYLTGRLKKGEPMMTEALGIVFLTAGLAILMQVSFLLAGMVVGATIANFARHHKRPFHEIEHFQWPFMILFFILAGASLDTSLLAKAGFVGVAYALLRIASRILGGWAGAALAGAPEDQRRWFGPALLPQAGVAVGMALVAAQEFPEFGGFILTLTIGTTVLFELIGPVATIIALRRVEQAGRDGAA